MALLAGEEILGICEGIAGKFSAALEGAKLPAKKEDRQPRIAAAFFFTKAARTMAGLKTLWVAGYDEDAVVLARSLTEILLQAAYLNQEPAVRAAALLDHVEKSKVRMLKRRQKGEEKRDASGKPALRQLSHELTARNPKIDLTDPQKLHDNWWKGTLADLADAWLGEEHGEPILDDYYSSYIADSHYAHTSPLVMPDYIEVHGDALSVLKESPLRHDLDVVINAAKRFLGIAMVCAEIWELPAGHEVLAAVNQVGTLAGHRRASP